MIDLQLIPITAKLRSYCLEETIRIINNPLSDWYKTDPKEYFSDWDSYLKICPTPICLTEVSKRAKCGYYIYIHEWVDDVQRVFINAIKANPPGSPQHELAKYLLKKFHKRLQYIPTNNNYFSPLYKLLQKYLTIVGQLPPNFLAVAWTTSNKLPDKIPNSIILQFEETPNTSHLLDFLKYDDPN
jgi:hypothetical protein